MANACLLFLIIPLPDSIRIRSTAGAAAAVRPSDDTFVAMATPSPTPFDSTLAIKRLLRQFPTIIAAQESRVR